MIAKRLAIPDVVLFEPVVFSDERELSIGSFNQRRFEAAVGININTVQGTHSAIQRGMLGWIRPIQWGHGKLICLVRDKLFDFLVNVRTRSQAFGQWIEVYLSSQNKQKLLKCKGVALGFFAVSETTEVLNNTTGYYALTHNCSLLWNNQRLSTNWFIVGAPALGTKNNNGTRIASAEVFA